MNRSTNKRFAIPLMQWNVTTWPKKGLETKRKILLSTFWSHSLHGWSWLPGEWPHIEPRRPSSMQHFIVPTNDQNVGTWIKDGCLERYESNLCGKLNLSEGASQCFWPIHMSHWSHSACFNNEPFCNDLRCACSCYTFYGIPHETTRQLQSSRGIEG